METIPQLPEQPLATSSHFHEEPPKRPPNPFLRFLSAVSPDLKELHPGIKRAELTKKGSLMWKSLSQEQQQPYRDAFRTENERYLANSVSWKEKYGGPNQRETSQRKPKRPPTAFLRFIMDIGPKLREENPGAKQNEVMKIGSGLWQDLPSEKKQPYHDAYRDENESYLVDYASWKEKYGTDNGLDETEKADVKRPKRPPTAFFRYRNKEYSRLKKDNPGVKSSGLTKIASEMWKNLSSDEKQQYHDAYRADNESYRVAYTAWKEKYGESNHEDIEDLGEVNPPKRPRTAFIRFANDAYSELKEEYPGTKKGELMKICSGLWSELPSEEKQPYHNAYRVENESYLVEYAAWKENYGEDSEEFDETKPPKRPKTAFLRFLSSVYSELKNKNPGAKSTELTKLASEMWKSLPPEKKRPYHDAYQVENERYLREHALWEKRGSEGNPVLEKTSLDTRPLSVPSLPPSPQTKPKHPQSAYFRFVEENYSAIRSQNPRESHEKAIHNITMMWKELDDSQRDPYRKSYEAEKLKYDADLAKWKEKIRMAATARPSPMPKKGARVPKKKSEKPFWVFARKNRQRIRSLFPKMGFREIDRQIRIEWRRLSQQEKREYLAGYSTCTKVTGGGGKRVCMVVDETNEEEEEEINEE